MPTAGWTKDPRFIGLDNFRELLDDDRFFAALRFTLFETAMIVVGYTSLSLVLAVLLYRMKVMRSLVRGLFFYPFILSILVGCRPASRLFPAPRDRPVKRRLPLFEIGMLLLGLLYVSPCVLTLLNSFKTLPGIVRSPVAPPEAPTLENYHYIFTGIKLAAPMFNNLLMCVAVITTLIVASMAAYSLTRHRTSTGNFWRIFFLAGTSRTGTTSSPTSWSCRCPSLYSILPCSTALSKN